jgi:predicted Zn finger-like uncharacterized protein
MLRVECESCKAPYQVDERRIPTAGLKMRCPKCGHTFVVKAGAGEPVPPPDPHARSTPGAPPIGPSAAGRKMQASMLGVGSGISKPPPSALAKKEPKDRDVTPSESEVGLPAARPATPGPAGAPKPPPRVGGPSAFKGTIVSAVPAPQRTAGDADLPAIREDAGLPAVRDDAGLPVARARGASPQRAPGSAPAIPSAIAAAAAQAATPVAFGEVDLPTATKGKTVPASNADLPVAANGSKAGSAVSPRPSSGNAALPANAAPAAPPAKPAPAPPLKAAPPTKVAASPNPEPLPPPPTSMDGFGEIDLPSFGGGSNLPAIASNNLPVVAANLPAVADALPVPAAVLPSPANVLPSPANVLPSPANVLPVAAEILPTASPSPPAAPFARAADPIAPDPISVPPQPISLAPDPISVPPELADFGELDLPPPPAPPPPARAAGRMEAAPVSLSEAPPLDAFDLPPLQTMSLPPGPDLSAPSFSNHDDGMSFGEVNLAVDELGASPLEAEAPIDVVPPSMPEAKTAVEEAIPLAPRKQRPAQAPGRKTGRNIMLGLVAAAVLVGGGLELTSYGAFGRLAIVDAVRAGDYQRRTAEVAATTRRKMASDLFPDARAACDEAASAHAEMPRARGLTAYAAFVEYATQLRFGPASDRIPRVRQWIAELGVEGGDQKYLPVAIAAQQALAGDAKKALAALDAASKRDAGDPLQEDIALVRGEIELAQHDPTAALAAFTHAGTLAKTARAEFGRARALVMAHDEEGAKKALKSTLALVPNHVGARIELATLAWESKDEAAALADLAFVLDGEAKGSASDAAKAQAQALRGWIHVARGRAADARTAFDAALKLDPRNVSALVGQGEVLYTESRFTEALTRFDTAVQTDPTSIRAIVSDAKAKLALERLADAKTQLAAARAKWPKDWRVAFWLGKAELTLGNKPAAEKELLASVELLDVKDPDAFQPYVTLATLYAGQGKTKDAEARLAEAKAKLPDTSSLRRALGDVAASRGDFEGAVQHFRMAIEKDPLDLSTRFRLGVTLRRMRKVDEASAEFDKIVAVDKDYPGLALERGLLYEESGDIEKALEQFQSALARAPNDADLQLRVGASYVAIGRPGDAVPMLRKVYEKRAQSAEANHFLGRALFLQGGAGSQVEAMRFLKRAAELDPNRAEYHLYVGWAANNAIPAQLGLARDAIEKALAIDKLLADAYWQRGVLERKQGAVDDAIADLKHALALKPTLTDAHAGLAECYSDKNDVGTAISEWQKALAADSSKPDWHFQYGKLLFVRGSVGDAATHLVTAADEGEKMEPKPGWLAQAEFLSGEVLRKTGKKAEAIERYRRFLEIAPSNSPDKRDAQNALADMGSGPRTR